MGWILGIVEEFFKKDVLSFIVMEENEDFVE